MDLKSGLKLLLRISIISSVSGLLSKRDINSPDFLINILVTTIGWGFIITLYEKNKENIKKLDKKIGYQVSVGIFGPLVLLLVRILIDPICFLTYDKFILTMFTILGFTIFNVFFRNRILDLKINDNFKEIIQTIIKPAIIITTHECYTGFDINTIYKILSVVTGFLTHLFIIKKLDL